jgi:hypothetical protein
MDALQCGVLQLIRFLQWEVSRTARGCENVALPRVWDGSCVCGRRLICQLARVSRGVLSDGQILFAFLWRGVTGFGAGHGYDNW